MSTIKLNERYRARLLKLILDDRFGKEEEALSQAKKELGDEIYSLTYTEQQIQAMESLPAGFLEASSEISFCVEPDCYDDYPMSRVRPVASSYRYRSNALPTIPSSSPIGRRYDELEEADKKLRAQRRKLSEDVKGLLYSVTTVKRLVAVWPEVEPYVNQIFEPAAQTSTAMVPSTDAINLALGLPKGEGK